MDLVHISGGIDYPTNKHFGTNLRILVWKLKLIVQQDRINKYRAYFGPN